MLLSIIVPIYNQEKYLERCLNSIYNQGLSEDTFELILVNDGSTDRSLEIMQAYATSHSNVRMISKGNEGLSATRNCGIKEAKGDYIYMPDSDDYLIPNGLSYVITNYLTKEIDVLIFFSQTVRPKNLPTTDNNISGKIVYDGNGRDFIKTNFNFSAWNLIIRSKILKDWSQQKQVFDERTTMEDKLFNVDLALLNPRYRVINSNIYRYITNPSSEMTSKDSLKLRKHIHSYEIILSEIQSRINKEIDKDVKSGIEKVAQGIYIPFTNRLLASNYSYKEFLALCNRLKNNHIIKPKSRVLSLLFNYPYLFIPTKMIYSYLFRPIVLPLIKMRNA